MGVAQHATCLLGHTVHHVDKDDGAVAQPHRRGHLTREIDVSRRIHKIQKMLRPLVDVPQRDGAGLHRDTPLLLVWAGVEQPNLASELRGEDAVARNQVVAKRGLAVIHVRHHAEVAGALGPLSEALQGRGGLKTHVKSERAACRKKSRIYIYMYMYLVA
ncbi:uncharacterized protein Tco025E_00066 [Trypanosoma conorhini]|uniref:Uncharacterized protein n=1 Tax=Trypanosoma conorhini TaxID=83891 RepID=A0A3R7P243_9TRYP|nr:uncharacterized protein Tco025E_00066 [Trypanosoma conorhini]RNF27682.1 hypothetical protein Tco025E_00066 [Trypanosoma conorhini]